MPPVQWPLKNNRPQIEIVLPQSKPPLIRQLIADTGAGSSRSVFQIVLDERDCLRSAGKLIGLVTLGGAYAGQFRVYLVEIEIPSLGFVDSVPVVGVSQVPRGSDGIAAFKFINRFHYGNFGDPGSFGLE
jgi:hypothetical protein